MKSLFGLLLSGAIFFGVVCAFNALIEWANKDRAMIYFMLHHDMLTVFIMLVLTTVIWTGTTRFGEWILYKCSAPRGMYYVFIVFTLGVIIWSLVTVIDNVRVGFSLFPFFFFTRPNAIKSSEQEC
ncbi:MAG: hypothetical protein LKJ83_02660 [Eubacteriaceae bacterium]|jgi:hypothetical protein|nr:hypothetical protein [Eubacteriaceae bacterium]